MKKLCLLLALVGASGATLADPAPLVIDNSVNGMGNPRHIKNVHRELKTGGKGLDSIRAAIRSAMSEAKGGPWIEQDEGEGFILARMQYRDNSMTLRIEYNEEFVQLKYFDATNLYVCEIVVDDGICYKNYRDYYGFAQNLRGSIKRALKRG